MSRIVFTCGDINGIGPEIAIKALNKISKQNNKNPLILLIPENVFKAVSKRIKPLFKYCFVNKINSKITSTDQVHIFTIGSFKQRIGIPTITSGKASFLALKTSFKLLKNEIADAVVTAPVSKTALKLAGIKYRGQTEIYADWCGVKKFVMTFLSKKLRVCLYSIHIPLREVPKLLNKNELSSKLDVIISTLQYDLGIRRPKIAVLGLNPHAGEKGIIGREETDIIDQVIKRKQLKESIDGPFSADAFFANRRFKDYDIVLGMYHDQVLIPFKYISSGRGVNYTAGLPIVRTSPDHGTAYDIAGKGIADESSMLEAFRYAELIVRNRMKSISAE